MDKKHPYSHWKTQCSVYHINSVVKYVLQKARIRIFKKRNWCKDYEAKTDNGSCCYCDSTLADKWSAGGAVKREIYDYFPKDYNSARLDNWSYKHRFIQQVAEAYLEDDVPYGCSLRAYNDCKETKHQKIIGVFNKTIGQLERVERQWKWND